MAETSNASPVTVLVEFQVRSETTTPDEWLEVWSDRGMDALTGEPETSAYEALTSAEDESRILIFERYQNSDSSLEAHRARPAHAALTEVMGSRRMTKRRVMSNLFSDVENYGWWDRPEYAGTLRESGLNMLLIVSRFPDEALREQYLQLTGEHAEYCRAVEPGTLIYSGGIATRDSDRGPAIKAGDLLFVAVFADDAAAIKHRDDARHLALQEELVSVERERVMVQSYVSSARGYLWKSRR